MIAAAEAITITAAMFNFPCEARTPEATSAVSPGSGTPADSMQIRRKRRTSAQDW
jgi:hypothetical protein